MGDVLMAQCQCHVILMRQWGLTSYFVAICWACIIRRTSKLEVALEHSKQHWKKHSKQMKVKTLCNGKLWYSNINQFCSFDMFRNFVKNSNSMCDVARSMWLLFSLFLRNWQVLRQQRARTSKNTGAPPWQKPETARTSENRLFLRC